MNEFRRTLLLVVLMMSLLMLFDKWRVYHGESSLLAPRPAAKVKGNKGGKARAATAGSPEGPPCAA